LAAEHDAGHDGPGAIRTGADIQDGLRDDLPRLAALRQEADRLYNDALTRLDRAIQQLPSDFPHPPPVPDEKQVTPLNALWKIDAPAAGSGLRQTFVTAVRQAVTPLFEQQQAFNAAVVDHINRTVAVDRQTRSAIESTLAVLRSQLEESIRFQSVLVMFLQQITPYVDTRDRDVAGLLRGLSGAINAVADELMKRSEALLARDARREQHDRVTTDRVAAFDERLTALEASVAELGRRVRPSEAS
jgi:uncharacterized coiled-coil protein SlyX